MISKKQLNELYSWALTAKDSKIRRGLATYGKAASFVNENVDEFENYMVTGNWLKMTRKLTNIRKKVMPDHIYKIYENPEILYSGYAHLKPHFYIKPHKDPDVYSARYKRVQIPLSLPERDKIYMTWEDGRKVFWEEGVAQVWHVMDYSHSGNNESDKSAKFLFLDVTLDTEVEL
tara:strand:- start:504 stop:1028 length:525 start_codon:yes stop_codon:yes gene_type:complete